jgi:hypothetical protein
MLQPDLPGRRKGHGVAYHVRQHSGSSGSGSRRNHTLGPLADSASRYNASWLVTRAHGCLDLRKCERHAIAHIHGTP